MRSRLANCLSPLRMLGIFTAINMLNYLDRGIVPGAFNQVGDFITAQIHTNNTDVVLGGLQSSFIAGYGIAGVVFGRLVHFYPPFKLMTVGLLVWCCAVVLSGSAPNLPLLFLARVLSGVGEASFQTVVPPYIDDTAPKESRGLWLAIFYSAIPVGTAIGYGYASVIATSISWRLAFLLEAPMMLPFVLICWLLPDKNASSAGKPVARTSSLLLNEDTPSTNRKASLEIGNGDDSKDEEPVRQPFTEELADIFKCSTFNVTVLGYTAYAWVTAGFASFGPVFLQGLNLFKSQNAASLSFGAMVALSGFIGTALGGILLDRLQIRDWNSSVSRFRLRQSQGRTDTGLSLSGPIILDDDDYEEAHDLTTSPNGEPSRMLLDSKLCASTQFSAISIAIGFVFCLLSPLVASALGGFFSLLALGCIFLFATSSAVNICIMASVPPKSRPLAIGISTVLMHALGDVPSPTVIGAVADVLSPKHKDGTRSVLGLKVTLFTIVIWLVWSVLFWSLGYILARRQRARNEASEDMATSLLSK